MSISPPRKGSFVSAPPKQKKKVKFTCSNDPGKCVGCGVCVGKCLEQQRCSNKTRTRKLSKKNYEIIVESDYNHVKSHLEPRQDNYVNNSCRISGGKKHKHKRKRYTKKKRIH